MNSFFQRLEARAKQIDSLLCVGIDPHAKDLLNPGVEGVRDFCLRLISATAELAVAYKPNIAFFESFGPPGLQVLKEVIEAIPAEIPVILDAKRGDIASTAEAYVRAVFEVMGASAVTLSPYLGYDSIEPFLRDSNRGVFLLCKTSNPGSADLQDVILSDGQYLYERVARLAQEWNCSDNVGLVAGATHPEALRRIRSLAPELWILAPGIGAQGGELQAALQAGLRSDGLGLLIPVSRGISQAPDVSQAAQDVVNAIREGQRIFGEKRITQQPERERFVKNPLLDGLLDAGCIKFGQFTLKSGMQSPIYLDLRQLISFPPLLAQVAAAYLPILRLLSFDRLAALPYAAIPIGAAISLQGGYPLIYPRKEAKAYGTKVDIEGLYKPGETVVVIDDLVTTGGSKFEAIEKLTAAGLKVRDVVVLIDRQSGASEALQRAGFQLHAVFKLMEMLAYWEASQKVSSEKVQAVKAFLSQTNEG